MSSGATRWERLSSWRKLPRAFSCGRTLRTQRSSLGKTLREKWLQAARIGRTGIGLLATDGTTCPGNQRAELPNPRHGMEAGPVHERLDETVRDSMDLVGSVSRFRNVEDTTRRDHQPGCAQSA